ncbi:MAG: hypothetical protein AB1488_05605 [Nitrospirota bacterium]
MNKRSSKLKTQNSKFEVKSLRLNFKKIGIVTLILVVLYVALWGWYRPSGVYENYIPVKVPKYIQRIKTVEVPVEKVVALEKKEVADKLGLPKSVEGNPEKQVLTAGEVPPHEGKTTVTAVMDTKTGITQLLQRQERPPLIAMRNEFEIGIDYGIGNRANFQLFANYDAIRIGKVHLGLHGQINQRGDYMASVRLSYRW